MIKLSKELKTGIVAIAIIAISIWGYNYLKGHNLFNGAADTYFTEYSNVQGLNTASPVMINGVQVGKVINIQFNDEPDKKGTLKVEFTMEADFQFSKKSIAKIRSASLMGGKTLTIIPSYEGPMAESGDYLKGEIESDMFSSLEEKFNPLQAKLVGLMVNADSLLVHMNGIVDAESRGHIKNTIAKLDATMTNLERITADTELIVVENRSKISNSVSNAETMTQNFAKLSDTLANANIGELIAKIETTVDNLQGITAGINNGEGTLGKFVKDEAVYDNLENATKEMEELLRDLKLHPKRYVRFSLFGKKDTEYTPTSSSKK